MDDEEILTKVKNSLKLVKSKIKEVSNGINHPRIDFFEKQLWKITEELEYSASLISITFGLGDYYPDFNDPEKMTLAEIVKDIRDDLDRIEKILDSDPKEGYSILRSAIHKTRVIQSNLKNYF
ncbi:hypothetical protein AC481_06485 [miscellaneous Crenarchaeota group archaeon SMTZ-80]|nr:MAG: hypothetical protein AC481_06485 [miscellaneous Crenarchaeota group archaeon SMTZ-80]